MPQTRGSPACCGAAELNVPREFQMSALPSRSIGYSSPMRLKDSRGNLGPAELSDLRGYQGAVDLHA